MFSEDAGQARRRAWRDSAARAASIMAATVALLCCATPAVASANTFMVTTVAETGPGSLAQAIEEANEHPGTDAIQFKSGLGKVEMPESTGFPAITEALAIEGCGGQTRIEGGCQKIEAAGSATAAQVFEISGPHVTLDGLRIEATAYTEGPLVLDNVTGPNLRITSSTLTGHELPDIRAAGSNLVVGSMNALHEPEGADTINVAGIEIQEGSNDLIAGDTITTDDLPGITTESPSVQDTLIVADKFTTTEPFTEGVRVSSGSGIEIGDPDLIAEPNEFTNFNEPIAIASGASAFLYDNLGIAHNEGPFDTVGSLEPVAPTISSATTSAISGEGEPGASVEVIDAGPGPAGSTSVFDGLLGTTTVESDGKWQFVPSSATAGRYVTAIQNAPGTGSSEPAAAVVIKSASAPTGVAFAVPTNTNPAGGTRPPRTEEPLTFTASATAPGGASITSYTWSFGDGSQPTTTSTPSIEHAYEKPGSYQVTLTVSASNKTAVRVSHGIQIAADIPPIAAANEIQASYTVGEISTFNTAASSDPDGKIAKWEVKIDGSVVKESTTNPPKGIKFETEGKHTISVTVTDDEGEKSTHTYNVDVLPVAPAPPGPGETSLNKLTFKGLPTIPQQTFTPSPSQTITGDGQTVLSQAPAASGGISHVAACAGGKCSTYTPVSLELNSCADSAGSNSAVVITGECLRTGLFGRSSEEPEDQVANFISSDPVFVDGVELRPASGGTIDVAFNYYTGGPRAGQQIIAIGGFEDMTFEDVHLWHETGGTAKLTIEEFPQGGGVYRGYIDSFGAVGIYHAPSDATYNGLPIASFGYPTFSGGKASVGLYAKLPAEIGGGTSSAPTTITNGSLEEAIAAAPAGSPGVRAAGRMAATPFTSAGSEESCGTVLSGPAPSSSKSTSFKVPSAVLDSATVGGITLKNLNLVVAGPDHYIVKAEASFPFAGGAEPAGSSQIDGKQLNAEGTRTGTLKALLELDPAPTFRFACAQATFATPGFPLGSYPVYLKQIELGVLHTGGVWTTSGTLALNAGSPVSIPFLGERQPFEAEGTATIAIPNAGSSEPWGFGFQGDTKFLGMTVSKGSLRYWAEPYGEAEYEVPLIWLGGAFTLNNTKIQAKFGKDPQGHFGFNVDGKTDLDTDLFQIGSGELVASDIGIGGCGSIGVNVGFGEIAGHGELKYKWGESSPSASVGPGNCEGELEDVEQSFYPRCKSLEEAIANPETYYAAAIVFKVMLEEHACVNLPNIPLVRRATHPSANVWVAGRASSSRPLDMFGGGLVKAGESTATELLSGLKSTDLIFTGSERAPLVTLIGPKGEEVHTFTGAYEEGGKGEAGATGYQDEATKQTVIELSEPEGGIWTIEVDQGSSPLENVQHEDDHNRPTITAKVKKAATGTRTETLEYEVGYVPNQIVSFRESGGESHTDAGQTIATLSEKALIESGGKGTIEFEPANGSAGTRTIEALVEVGEGQPEATTGTPVKTLTLGTYAAPAPVLPAAVGGLTVAPSGEGAQVTWGDDADTETYAVTVSTSGGRSFIESVHEGQERKVDVPDVSGGEIVAAKVIPFDAEDREGPPSEANAQIGSVAQAPLTPPGGTLTAETPGGSGSGGSGGGGASGPGSSGGNSAPGPGPAPHAGTASLKSTALSANHGAVSVTVTCSGGSCSGTLTLSAPAKASKGKHKRKTKPVTLGSVHFTLAAGTSQKLTIHLGGAGAKLLASAHGSLHASAVLALGGSSARTLAVTIRAAKPKQAKRRG